MNKQKKIFITRKVSFLNCPACSKVGSLHKSKTKNITENIFKNLYFWGYFRCWECNWRGLLIKKTITKQSFKLLLLYVLLFLGSSYIVLIALRLMIS